MSNQEIVREVKSIKSDLIDKKITYNEAIDGLTAFSEYININFSILYNMLYSSKPEMYLS